MSKVCKSLFYGGRFLGSRACSRLWRITKIFIFLFPAIYSIFTLSLGHDFESIFIDLIVPLFYFILSLAIFSLSIIRSKITDYFKYIIILPCALSPIFISGTWVMFPYCVPGGVGSGGFHFFLHWLTKYPNIGPINYEVGLGMICVLSTHLIPYLYFLLIFLFNKNDKYFGILLPILTLVFYIPVFIRLDSLSWAFIISGYIPYRFFYSGLLFRFLAVLSMTLILIKNCFLIYKAHSINHKSGLCHYVSKEDMATAEWYVILGEVRLALLRSPLLEDMFWVSLEIVPLAVPADPRLYDNDFWIFGSWELIDAHTNKPVPNVIASSAGIDRLRRRVILRGIH